MMVSDLHLLINMFLHGSTAAYLGSGSRGTEGAIMVTALQASFGAESARVLICGHLGYSVEIRHGDSHRGKSGRLLLPPFHGRDFHGQELSSR